MAKVIVIHNYNGGVGKTTMALALARHFSKEQNLLPVLQLPVLPHHPPAAAAYLHHKYQLIRKKMSHKIF